MAAPLCEHCAYELTGIAVENFVARCPECGLDSDVRRYPRPVVPWWHSPVALLAGSAASIVAFCAYAALDYWFRPPGKPVENGWFVWMCPLVGSATALLCFRKHYAALWRYKYGSKKVPNRAWLGLLFDGIWYALAIVILDFLVLWGVSLFFP